MNCQSCESIMLPVYGQSHYRCSACNTFSFATELESAQCAIIPQGKKTAFQCPKCVLPLEVGLVKGRQTQVCFCSNCRGFVLSSESLGELATELRAEYQGEDDRPQPIDPKEMDLVSNCPACWEKMDSHPYYGPGNIVLDTCTHCKLAWLDHGELAKIVRAPGVRIAVKK